MKKSRFTDSQIIAVLKQAEAGTPVPELCRQHGISSATLNYRGQVHFLADSVETNRLAIGGPVRLCKPSATTLEHPHQPTPLPGKTWNTLTRSRYNPRNRDRHPARVARFFLPAHASNWAGWSASWIVPTQSAVAVWHWGIACTSPPLRSPTRPAPR